MDMPHARLDKLARTTVGGLAVSAAAEMADAGGSPRAQIDAARAASGDRLTYMPHQGMRERQKALARVEKATRKANIAR